MNRPMQFVATALLWLAALPALASTSLSFTSEPGDIVGQGTHGTWTAPTATFFAGGTAADFYVYVQQNTGEYLSLRFTAPPGQVLGRGVYRLAENSDHRIGNVPGISIASPTTDYYSCTKAWGSFSIRQIAFDENGQISRLAVTFWHRCGAANAPLLSGTLYFNTDAQSFVSTSAAGDPIGGGINRAHYGTTSDLVMTGDQYTVIYEVTGLREQLWLVIDAPAGQTLKPGTYPISWNFGPRPAANVGMDIHHHDGRCEGLSGSLVIRRIGFDTEGAVKNLDASMTAYCVGSAAAYKATIRHTN